MPPVFGLAIDGQSTVRRNGSSMYVIAVNSRMFASKYYRQLGVFLGVSAMSVALPAFAADETALDQAGKSSSEQERVSENASQEPGDASRSSQSRAEFTAPAPESASHSSSLRHPLILAEPNPPPDPKAYSLALSGGASWFDASLDSSNCQVVSQLGPTTPNFRMQLGRQWFNQIQLQLDLGVINSTVESCSKSEGEPAGEDIGFQMFTLELGVGYRFDYLEEQPLVPYLNLGLAESLIQLTASESSEDDSTAIGHRLGGYAGGGLEILLDTFSPTRAADLELSSGINDTYLVLDARYLWEGRYLKDMALATEDRLVFYGWQVTAGLKLDF